MTLLDNLLLYAATTLATMGCAALIALSKVAA